MGTTKNKGWGWTLLKTMDISENDYPLIWG